ncbi:MAG: SIMPL domain-containing protein [Kofleriaceae bacterium]|nr:SIMPL domain-containing protein [Kofleriaceae bacterium]MCB9572988.1 SIMPL domain-containing protein [Kofleriaceae bacterium]
MQRPFARPDRPFVLATALALALAGLAAACREPAASSPAPCCGGGPGHAGAEPPPRTLAVSGTATLDVVPDVADVVLSVTGEASRPKAAVEAARGRQRKLDAALRKLGLVDADIALSQLSISPTWEPDTGRRRGYAASITLTASTRDFDLIGAIMDVGADAGVTDMSTSFRHHDLPALKRQVRDLALAAVKDKATQTVAALGATLGDVQQVAESTGPAWGGWAPPVENVYSAQPLPDRGPHGDLQALTLTVNVTYALR